MGVLADTRLSVVNALKAACVTAHPTWQVLGQPIDGMTAPAFIVQWSDPFLDGKATFCTYTSHLDVRIIGTRLEPQAGSDELELMVELAVVTLAHVHAVRTVSKPGPYEVDGVRYLSVVASLDAIVNIGGS